MTYVFRCPTHGKFEVKQRIHQTHEAICPICSEPTRRVYTPLIHYWPDVLWNRDGSRQSPDELPPVPSGTKWTHGWTPKEEE